MNGIKKNCLGCRLTTSTGCKIEIPTEVITEDCGDYGNLVYHKPTVPCPKPKTHAEANLIYSNFIENKQESFSERNSNAE